MGKTWFLLFNTFYCNNTFIYWKDLSMTTDLLGGFVLVSPWSRLRLLPTSNRREKDNKKSIETIKISCCFALSLERFCRQLTTWRLTHVPEAVAAHHLLCITFSFVTICNVQLSFPVSHKVGNIVNFVLDLNVLKFNIKLFTVVNLLEFSYIFCIYIFLDIYRKFT